MEHPSAGVLRGHGDVDLLDAAVHHPARIPDACACALEGGRAAVAAAASCLAQLPRPHSTEQTLYFDSDGLLARHDYEVEISGGVSAAHYVSDYYEVAGIRRPTKHRILPCDCDGEIAHRAPLVVSIDVSELSFT